MTARSGSSVAVRYNLADFPPGMVGIPAVDWMWTDSAEAFLQLTQGLPPGSLLTFGRESASAAYNRNRLTEEFLSHPEFEWILYCDSDQTPPVATIARLLSHDVDVVGALCVMRRPPYTTWFGELLIVEAFNDGAPLGGLHAVSWVGSGCLMVKREVIEAMPFPWWEHPSPGEAEDVLFGRKATELGFSVYVDCSLLVGHMSVRAVDVRDSIEFAARPEGKAMLERIAARTAAGNPPRHVQNVERGSDAAIGRMKEGVSTWEAAE